MSDDLERVPELYARAQKFLALEIDEEIDPDEYGEGEMSDAERLIAEMACVLAAAQRALSFLDMDEAGVNRLRTVISCAIYGGENSRPDGVYYTEHTLRVLKAADAVLTELRKMASPTQRDEG